MQISGPEHLVIESKPDSEVMDLRFHAPWPQLQSLAQSVDLENADDITHKHVPYGVFLLDLRQIDCLMIDCRMVSSFHIWDGLHLGLADYIWDRLID